jgi:hypothetical protein
MTLYFPVPSPFKHGYNDNLTATVMKDNPYQCRCFQTQLDGNTHKNKFNRCLKINHKSRSVVKVLLATRMFCYRAEQLTCRTKTEHHMVVVSTSASYLIHSQFESWSEEWLS